MKKACKESDNMKIARILEKRLTRLEKMMKNEAGMRLPYDIMRDLNEVFSDHFGNEDNYDSRREFGEHIFAAQECENDMMVDDAIMYLVNDYDYEEDILDSLRDEITDYIAGCAANVAKEEGFTDEGDWDWGDYVDEDNEALNRRVARLERLITDKATAKRQKVEKRSLLSRFRK